MQMHTQAMEDGAVAAIQYTLYVRTAASSWVSVLSHTESWSTSVVAYYWPTASCIQLQSWHLYNLFQTSNQELLCELKKSCSVNIGLYQYNQFAIFHHY